MKTNLSGTVFLLLITNAFAATPKDEIVIPSNFSIPVSFTPGKYEKILINGRCMEASGEEMDGPKESIPLLDGDSASLQNVTVRSSKDKTLFELATIKQSKNTVMIAASQSGCSHFGVTLTLLTKEKINFKDQAAIWKNASNWFKEFPLLKHGSSETQEIKKWLATKNIPECEFNESKLICSSNEDPNNFELKLEPSKTKKEQTLIEFNYWYVM